MKLLPKVIQRYKFLKITFETLSAMPHSQNSISKLDVQFNLKKQIFKILSFCERLPDRNGVFSYQVRVYRGHLWLAVNLKVQSISDWKFVFCSLSHTRVNHWQKTSEKSEMVGNIGWITWHGITQKRCY